MLWDKSKRTRGGDMLGNVCVWCYDWYGDYSAQAATNPVGAATGTNRAARGGGSYDNAYLVRAAQRGSNTPSYCYNSLGFRVVRSGP